MSVVPLEWIARQDELRALLNIPDTDNIYEDLQYVVGMDISYIKDTDKAVCTGVILKYPTEEDMLSEWDIVHQESMVVTITEPYVPGYLAFREIPHYLAVYAKLRELHPTKCHSLVVVDGNGILHPHGFGLACHVGVLLDVPTIGCAKTLHYIDGLQKSLLRGTDGINNHAVEIKGQSGKIYGYAVRRNINPVYLSPGHKVSLSTILRFSAVACVYREPEPTRIADRISRAYIRYHM